MAEPNCAPAFCVAASAPGGVHFMVGAARGIPVLYRLPCPGQVVQPAVRRRRDRRGHRSARPVRAVTWPTSSVLPSAANALPKPSPSLPPSALSNSDRLPGAGRQAVHVNDARRRRCAATSAAATPKAATFGSPTKAKSPVIATARPNAR